ncbi:hypothetical protein ASF98_03250 [Arthrobacter sp. Leaf337]|uniref:hypothetical protein n=1 Tax=Arthrobacter sp. Leaf337 TaxID=1736342 RepID=UPI0006F2B2E2|nr:hypothetical protein [Arthrobacter sp. Leaf337]KQR74890.1 hypothetical protein ASF98_03250 [Arthrobacter sp. Leaf337]
MDKNLSTSQATTRGNLAGDAPEPREFHVTYFDTDCGLIRRETFDSLPEAERFANRNISDEQGWAVIDAVPAEQGRLAA